MFVRNLVKKSIILGTPLAVPPRPDSILAVPNGFVRDGVGTGRDGGGTPSLSLKGGGFFTIFVKVMVKVRIFVVSELDAFVFIGIRKPP